MVHMTITANSPTVTLRLEHEDYHALKKLAEVNERSLAAEARFAVKAHLREKEAA